MKSLIVIPILLLLTFTKVDESANLPNGKYFVELDEKYKDRLNNYEFILQDEEFIILLEDTVESLKITWLDENSFIVKGLTESSVQTEETKNMKDEDRMVFTISSQKDNYYYFRLGNQSQSIPVYSGKFIVLK